LVSSSSSFSIKPAFVFYVEEDFISISGSAPNTNFSSSTSSQGFVMEEKMLSISGSTLEKRLFYFSFPFVIL